MIGAYISVRAMSDLHTARKSIPGRADDFFNHPAPKPKHTPKRNQHANVEPAAAAADDGGGGEDDDEESLGAFSED